MEKRRTNTFIVCLGIDDPAVKNSQTSQHKPSKPQKHIPLLAKAISNTAVTSGVFGGLWRWVPPLRLSHQCCSPLYARAFARPPLHRLPNPSTTTVPWAAQCPRHLLWAEEAMVALRTLTAWRGRRTTEEQGSTLMGERTGRDKINLRRTRRPLPRPRRVLLRRMTKSHPRMTISLTNTISWRFLGGDRLPLVIAA